MSTSSFVLAQVDVLLLSTVKLQLRFNGQIEASLTRSNVIVGGPGERHRRAQISGVAEYTGVECLCFQLLLSKCGTRRLSDERNNHTEGTSRPVLSWGIFIYLPLVNIHSGVSAVQFHIIYVLYCQSFLSSNSGRTVREKAGCSCNAYYYYEQLMNGFLYYHWACRTHWEAQVANNHYSEKPVLVGAVTYNT